MSAHSKCLLTTSVHQNGAAWKRIVRRLYRAQQASGKEYDGGDQIQRAMNSDPYETEGQQKQPYDGIRDKRQQSQRPAEKQKNTPQQEFDHIRKKTSSVATVGWPAKFRESV